MKPENKQRFSIRKYAVGAASVLIGFAFQAQAVAADGVVPATTENQPAVQTTGEVTPPTSEEKRRDCSFNKKMLLQLLLQQNLKLQKLKLLLHLS